MKVNIEYIEQYVVFLPLYGNGGAHRASDGAIHLIWNPEEM